MPQIQTLSVYCNPYAHLDADGEPCGAVLLDPVQHHPYGEPTIGADGAPVWEQRRYVGASIHPERTKVFKRATPHGHKGGMAAQADLQTTAWEFSSEPQTVPLTGYYLDRIRDGELIPADAATALTVGRLFVAYDEAITSAKVHALGLFYRERPDRAAPEWATPDHLANLYHASDEFKAAHAKQHAEKLAAKAAAEKAAKDAAKAARPPTAPTTAPAAPPAPPPRTTDTPVSTEVK